MAPKVCITVILFLEDVENRVTRIIRRNFSINSKDIIIIWLLYRYE